MEMTILTTFVQIMWNENSIMTDSVNIEHALNSAITNMPISSNHKNTPVLNSNLIVSWQ